MLQPFAVEKVRKQLLAAADEAETWLYTDEGYAGTLKQFTERLDQLTKVGHPIAKRHSESTRGPEALRNATEKIVELRARADAALAKGTCAKEAVDRAKLKFEELQKWVDSTVKTQKSQDLTRDVAISAEEITTRTSKLESATNDLLRVRPKIYGLDEDEPWWEDPRCWTYGTLVTMVVLFCLPLSMHDPERRFLQFGRDTSDFESDPLHFFASLSSSPEFFKYLQHATMGPSASATAMANVFLHILNVVGSVHVSLSVLENIRAVRGSASANSSELACSVAAALFFAVHPLVIPLVAWHAGQAVLLGCTISLLVVYCHLRFQGDGSKQEAGLSYSLGQACAPIAFGLAITCSSVALPLPAMLLCFDLYISCQRETVDIKSLCKCLLPNYLLYAMLVLVGVFVVVPVYDAVESDLLAMDTDGPAGASIFQAVYVAAYHLVSMIAPIDLMFYYALPDTDAVQSSLLVIGSAVVVSSLVVMVLLRLMWRRFRKRGDADAYLPILPAFFLIAVAYTIMIAPLGMRTTVISHHRAYGVLFIMGTPLLSALCQALLLTIAPQAAVDGIGNSRKETGLVLLGVALIGGYAWLGRSEMQLWIQPHLVWNQSLSTDDAVTMGQFGSELRQVGHSRLPEALHWHEQALQLNPTSSALLHEQALTFDQSGKSQDALEAFASAVQINPNSIPLRMAHGNSLENTGRFSEAEFQISRAMDLQLGQPTAGAFTRLGQAQQQQHSADSADSGDWPKLIEAKAAFSSAILLNPKLSSALAGLGDISGEVGKWIEAESYFTAALEAAPRRRVYQKSLAAAQIHNGFDLASDKKFDEALERYQAALVKDSRSVVGLNNYASLLHMQGRAAEASSAIHKAANLGGGDVQHVQANFGILAAEKGQPARSSPSPPRRPYSIAAPIQMPCNSHRPVFCC
jgi:tetratricopeptide (TPR) repeat protein